MVDAANQPQRGIDAIVGARTLLGRRGIGAGCTGWRPPATRFDGAVQAYVLPGDLSSDGTEVTFAAMFRSIHDGSSAQCIVGHGVAGGVGQISAVIAQTTGRVEVLIVDADGATTRYFARWATNVLDGAWHHVCGSFDLAAPAGRAYLDGVAPDLAESAASAGTFDWTTTQGILIGGDNFARWLEGDVGNVLMADVYVDLSVAANLAKLLDPATGLMVDVGAAGELLTGEQPLVYLPDITGGNLGSAGAFIKVGTPFQVPGP